MFGRIVGTKIPLQGANSKSNINSNSKSKSEQSRSGKEEKTRTISKEELTAHNGLNGTDCWVVIHSKVYDFTSYLEEHPGGAKSISQFGGGDGTKLFDTIHTLQMLDEFTSLGIYQE